MSYFAWLRRIVAANKVVLVVFAILALFSFNQIALEGFLYCVYTPGAKFEWMLKEAAFRTFISAWIAISAFYGLLRGWLFHPITNARYHAWLMRSPWEVGKPLPKGPVHPAWQDGVTLALLTLIVAAAVFVFDASGKWIAGPSLAMSAGMVVSWTVINLLTRHWAAPAVLLLVPLSILFSGGGLGYVVGMLCAAGIAYYGVWNLLSDLHSREPFDRKFANEVAAPLNRRGNGWQKNAAVGWPYDSLLHEPDDWRLPALQALIYAAIVSAWASVAILSYKGLDQQMVAFFLPYFLTGGAVLCRLLFDSSVMCPRFCLGHRLANRRLFVPAHDRLLLAPLLIILGGVAPFLVGYYLDRVSESGDYFITAAIVSVGLVVYLFFTLGRPVTEAFYTGPQTIAPGIRNAQCFAKLAAPGD